MKACEYLVRTLEQEGVRYAFGVHGSALTPLIDQVRNNSSITPILVRHEEGGAFMADGYARFSGGLGFCWGTSGPGTTNLLTGLATSWSDATPVLAITGQVPTSDFHRGAFQESTTASVDSVALLKAVTKYAELVGTPAQLPTLLRTALRQALTSRKGPAALVIPKDCLTAEIAGDPPPVFSYRVQNRVFDARMVGRAAELLRKSRRPALLVGSGVNLSRANRELIQLVHQLEAAVASTPKGKGAFPEDDPRFLGVLGLGGHPTAAHYILEHADLLLAVGTSLGQISTCNYDERLSHMPLIHLDVNPEEIGKNFPVEVGLVGDAQVILKELAKALLDGPRQASRASRRAYLDGFLAQGSRLIDPHLVRSDHSPIYPQRAVYELRRHLPRDAIVFWDSGNHTIWGIHYFEAYTPRTFSFSPSFGAMGYGVSACIGAKLARPDQTVVSVCGDGGFLMNGTEVSTAVNYGIPIIWVVMNNHGLGMVRHGDRVATGRDTGASIRGVDLVRFSEGLGARGLRAGSADEFCSALALAREANGPVVIDVEIDADQVPPLPALRPELKGVI